MKKPGENPKRSSEELKKMKSISTKEGIARQNMRADKMNAARDAIYGDDEKKTIRRLDENFAKIKPDSSVRKPYDRNAYPNSAFDKANRYFDGSLRLREGPRDPKNLETFRQRSEVNAKTGSPYAPKAGLKKPSRALGAKPDTSKKRK